jgi:hypothetical protein
MACLHGHFAIVRVGGALVANLRDWELNYETSTVDSSAYGDFWEVPVPVRSSWRLRASAYVTPNQAATLLSSNWNGDAAHPSFLIEAFSGSVTSQKVFQGSGFAIRGNLAAPNDAATQEVEFAGYGTPSVGV